MRRENRMSKTELITTGFPEVSLHLQDTEREERKREGWLRLSAI